MVVVVVEEEDEDVFNHPMCIYLAHTVRYVSHGLLEIEP